MFERYTEQARRAIFFARYQAQQFGSKRIEPAHLLLGLLHDSQSSANLLFGLNNHANNFRLKIAEAYPPAQPLPKTAELPLSQSNRRVLVYTAEEASRLGSDPIDTQHIVLGLLREKDPVTSALLLEAGVELKSARDLVAQAMGPTRSSLAPEAERKTLPPVVGVALIFLLLFVIGWIINLVLGK